MLRTVRESKGPCPVCGAPEHTCEGAPGTGVVFQGEVKSRFKSDRQVTEELAGRPGASVVKYNVGDPLPIIEAMRQGKVRTAELTEDERSAVRAHVMRGQVSAAEVKAWLTPPRDKQLKGYEKKGV